MATLAAAPAAASPRWGSDFDDHDLVAAVRAGDDRAFEQLYERYHRRIASYIYGMVNDFARAEDIAQDVFMSALRRMRETERPIAFKPWVYEIAKNACIDQFRRSRRAEEVSYDAEDGLGAADYGRLVQTGPTPDMAVDQKMSLDHLRGAFGGLSQTHHEILVMRELEGLSYREIGERLGMTRPSVESTLFRARRRLTEEYEELITGERCLRVQAIITTANSGALGARDQRKLARHVSYCQACRRHARMAGIDAAVLAYKPMRAKVAALLPLPAFLKRRGSEDVALASSHGQQVASWTATVAQYAEPGIVGWAKAAAAAATVAVAGLGASSALPGHDLGLSGGLPERAISSKPAVENVRHAAAPSTATSAPTPKLRPAGDTGAAGTAATVQVERESDGAAATQAPQESTPAGAPTIPDVSGIVNGGGSDANEGGSSTSGGSGHSDRDVNDLLTGATTAPAPAVPSMPGVPSDGNATTNEQLGGVVSDAARTAGELLGGG